MALRYDFQRTALTLPPPLATVFPAPIAAPSTCQRGHPQIRADAGRTEDLRLPAQGKSTRTISAHHLGERQALGQHHYSFRWIGRLPKAVGRNGQRSGGTAAERTASIGQDKGQV